MSTSNYLSIESVTPGDESKVRQTMKFRTGKFVWRVQFNTPLNPKTVNNVNLYVTDSKQQPLSTKISYNSEESVIEVEPIEPYATDESYFLNITTKVQSKGGQTLKKPIQVQFKL